MQENQRRPIRSDGQLGIEPLQRRGIELAIILTRHGGIQQQQHEPAHLDADIGRPGQLGKRLIRKCAAELPALVVVPWNCHKRQLERFQQRPQVRIFLLEPAIDEIAADHHEGRARPKGVEMRDAALERRRGVDHLVGALVGPLDMQVGDLRDQEGRSHGASVGRLFVAAASRKLLLQLRPEDRRIAEEVFCNLSL